MAAVVGIDSGHGLTIEVCYRNQPNKSKLALYIPLLHFNSHLKQLYISNKTEHFSCKGGCVVCVGVHVLRHFKEELAWATDKWLRIMSNVMLFKTVSYSTKKLKNKAF